MSYNSRKKKRKYKRLQVRARSARTEETARRFFLTLAKKPGKFGCCGKRFDRGDEIVFRYEPRSVRCVDCARRDPESKAFTPSIRWERSRRRRKTTTPSGQPAMAAEQTTTAGTLRQ
jgi:hypothetical protein